MAVDLMELLGALTQGGASSRTRSAAASSSDGIGGLLSSLVGSAGQQASGRSASSSANKGNLAAAGVGALLGALTGQGSGHATMSSVGGGMMGLLGMMAYKALKNAGQGGSNFQAGASYDDNESDEDLMSRLTQAAQRRPAQEANADASLIITAMVDAAKADGQVDQDELNKIVGKIKSAGLGQDGINYVIKQLQAPMNTRALINAGKNNPELAAQIYSASLMAIEVDTQAERKYLNDLAKAMGLSNKTITNLEMMMNVPQEC